MRRKEQQEQRQGKPLILQRKNQEKVQVRRKKRRVQEAMEVAWGWVPGC